MGWHGDEDELGKESWEVGERGAKGEHTKLCLMDECMLRRVLLHMYMLLLEMFCLISKLNSLFLLPLLFEDEC